MIKLIPSLLIVLLLTASNGFGQDPTEPAPAKEKEVETPASGQAEEPEIKDPSMVKREKTYAPLEIYEQIRSKWLPKEDLLKLLGEPDYKGAYKGQELWQYYNLTQSNKNKEKLWHQYFLFENGKVSYDWVTKDAGPPKEPEEKK